MWALRNSDLIKYITEKVQAGLGLKYEGKVAVSVICCPSRSSLIHGWTEAFPLG